MHINGKIDNRSPFDTSQITFPQLFQEAGYQTAMFVKLHFGNNPKGVDDFMILPGQGDYINPKFLRRGSDTIIKGYVTDIITDLTLGWLKEKRDKTKPFISVIPDSKIEDTDYVRDIILENRSISLEMREDFIPS